MGDERSPVQELLGSAASRWTSVRMQGRVWRDDDRGLSEGFSDEPWRVWVTAGGRARVELGHPDAGPLTIVCAGGTLWRSPVPPGEPAAIPRSGPAEVGPASALLDVAGLDTALALDVRTESSFLGRPALVVHARPARTADPAGFMPEALVAGADEYVLTVDAERGVLLRNEARRDGDPFLVVEATMVAFDEDLPDDLFTLENGEPQNGEPQDGEPEDGEPEDGLVEPVPDPREPDSEEYLPGPPPEVLGTPVPLQVVVVRRADLVLVVTELVAYPGGVSLTLSARSAGDEPPEADPGAISLEVGFVDGRSASTARRPAAPRALLPAGRDGPVPEVVFLDGRSRRGQADLRYWLTPLPPRGRLIIAVEWAARAISPTRVVVDSGPINDAARAAVTLW